MSLDSQHMEKRAKQTALQADKQRPGVLSVSCSVVIGKSLRSVLPWLREKDNTIIGKARNIGLLAELLPHRLLAPLGQSPGVLPLAGKLPAWPRSRLR